MWNMFPKRRLIIYSLVALVALGWGFYFFGLEAFLEAMYRGDLLSYFNEYAANWRSRQSDPSLEGFLEEGYSQLFRYSVLGTASVGVGLILYLFNKDKIEGYFSAKTSPFNLALFRITVFGTLLAFDLETTRWYAQLPSILQAPPVGLSWVHSFISIEPSVVSTFIIAFRVSCIFGILGLFTNVSAVIALISGLYILGIPQLYGKVGHIHHVLWFTALLIPSRCADVLSLDALRRFQQSPSVAPPSAKRRYALPIRYAWLLLGIVYFFPGFWKFASEGFGWALSENLKHEMQIKWFVKGFHPPIRIDKYPFLYKGAGLFTLLFEVGFIFALPFRIARYLAAGTAFLFHQSTQIFMRISFWSIQPFLLFLMDVRGILSSVASSIFPEKVFVLYDKSEEWQRFFAYGLNRLDLFNLVCVREVKLKGRLDSDKLIYLSSSKEIHSSVWKNGSLKLRPLYSLLKHSPFSIILLTLIYFYYTLGHISSFIEFNFSSSYFVSIIGLLLIFINVIFGLGQVVSYPFSVYPTFAGTADSTVTTLRIEGVDRSGKSIEILRGTQDHERAGFSAPRLRGLMNSILKVEDAEKRETKLRALWSVLRERRPELRSIVSLRIYEATYSTNPDRSSDPLLERSLLTTVDVSADAIQMESATAARETTGVPALRRGNGIRAITY